MGIRTHVQTEDLPEPDCSPVTSILEAGKHEGGSAQAKDREGEPGIPGAREGDMAISSTDLGDTTTPPPHRECTPMGAGEEAEPRPIMEQDWEEAYEECPRWKDTVGDIKSGDTPWPKGHHYRKGCLYQEGLLCVPSSMTNQLIRQHHTEFCYPGRDRL